MDSNSDTERWYILGKEVPKQEIVFFSQVIIIYILIITCIVNLSINKGEGVLWISLLSTCLGILLPNPSIKTGKKHLISSDLVDGRIISNIRN